MIDSAASTLPRKPKRHWHQFSLCSLLAVVAALCVGLGLTVNRAHHQRDTVHAILAAGGQVWYHHQHNDRNEWDPKVPPPAPDWLRRFVGDDYFQDVGMIWVGGDQA